MPIKIYPEEPVNYTSNLDDFSFNEGLIKSPEFDYGTGYQLSPTTTALTSPSSGASSSSGGGGESGGGGTWRGMKNAYLNQYKDVASQNLGSSNRQNLSYTDSPIFQKGFEAWNPTGLYSLIGQNLTLPMMNLVGLAGGKDYSGIAGIFGDETSAAFANKLINPIFSGTATPEEKQKFANVFGHEMSHLGWDYKDPSERINVPGVGIESDKAFAKWSTGKDYRGEEQWNFMHDLMYTPRGTSIDKFSNDMNKLKKDLASGKITQDQYKTLGGEKINQYQMSGLEGPPSRVKDYLTDKGLINKGDLSYTPRAYDEIAWSGLTTPSKRAIGFGINPFEDTRGAGQFYNQKMAPQTRFRQHQLMNRRKQDMQQRIREAEAAEVAKQKATAAQQVQQVQQNIQTYGNQDRPNEGMNAPGGGKGQSPTGGDVSGTPFNSGGLVDFYRYGGFIG